MEIARTRPARMTALIRVSIRDDHPVQPRLRLRKPGIHRFKGIGLSWPVAISLGTRNKYQDHQRQRHRDCRRDHHPHI